MDFYVPNTSDYSYLKFLNEHANLSLKNRDDMCKLAASFKQEKAIISIVLLQLMASFATLILLFLLYKDREIKRTMAIINKDLQIIIFTAFIVYIIASSNAFFVYIYKLSLLLLNLQQPCSNIISGTTCHWIQWTYALVCARAYLTLHTILLIERLYITFLNRNGRFGGVLGTTMSIFIMIYPVLTQLQAINPQIFSNDRLYCSSLYTVIDTKLTNSAYSVIVYDICITTGDCCLYIYNRYQIKKHKRQLSNFSLENSFILRQMQISIRIIFPYSVVHSIGYFTQMYLYVVYTQQAESLSLVGGNFMYELVNCGRIIGTFSLIFFLYIQNKLRSSHSNVIWAQQLDETDVYFRQFRQLIS